MAALVGKRWLAALGGLAGLVLLSGRAQCPKSASGRAAVPSSAQVQTHGIRFEEVAAQSGLRFRWNAKPHHPLTILDGFGCGCAFLDFDGDGFQDVLLVSEPRCALFRNDGHGRFTDVTHRTGLDTLRGAWKGCAVGDFDGDGWLDLLLTGYHRLALLRNREGASFTDVTRAAGLDPQNWSHWGASAGFMDLDGDGDLDLVVQNYLVWGPGVMQYCDYSGIKMACPPEVHDPERARLYRNNGDGTFTDVSAAAGFATTSGYGMIVGFADANGDGRPDIYLGNDGKDANFLENRGQLRFKDVALENGTAIPRSGKPLAAMGIDWADYDRDGRLDFSVSGFARTAFALFHHESGGTFKDVSAAVGLMGPTYLPLGFGTKFADVDNDGWPDLFFVNGHIFDRVARTDPAQTFRQRPMLFHNEQGKRFTDVAPALGGAWTFPVVGRGSASGDIDNDGRIDLLAVDYEGTPLLLHNASDARNHWLTLELRGRKPNRFAYGAVVTLRTGQEIWTGQVSPASSFLSSSDPRVHFGLGEATTIEKLTIRWPSGAREEVQHVPVDRILQLSEGRGIR